MENNKVINSDEISLKEVVLTARAALYYVFKYWYILLIVGGIGYGIGYLYEGQKKKMYTATTTFVLESNTSPKGNMSGLSAFLGGGGGTGSVNLFQGESLMELYKSRTILEEVLLSPMEDDSTTLLIQKLFSINEKLEEKLTETNRDLLEDTQFLLFPSPERQRQRDSIMNGAVNVAKGYFSVSYPNPKASMLQVNVSAEDEVFARSFNQQIVDKVNTLYMEIKGGKSYENVRILQHKADSVHRVLLSAISRVAASTDQTPNLNPTRGALRQVPVQDAQVKVEASRSLYAEFSRNLEMARLSLDQEVPLIKIIDEARYPLNVTNPNKNKIGILGAIGGVLLTGLLLTMVYVFKQIMKD
ncbi:hypothetical protein [Sphingobacterium wenxiniae]|uniref:Chain length determinant protein n=1 Tax=Sphingobacterium wenxiniae TaxID=683125 RepID=A0A1I6U7G8_9SPHI|nr:hypothetical protein [Sphingobacterium wenxiniae]SFS97393.1 hypothetical protein SAMN05660206_10837 [Sphingobacterium wenxiniae]